MRSNLEEARVEAMAISFEEQLSIVYPRGPHYFHLADSNNSNDDEVDSSETREEVILRNSLQNMINELPYPGDYKELKTAFTRAVQRWKSKNTQDGNTSSSNGGDQMMTEGIPLTTSSTKSTTSIGSSFSLLDQLQGGFAMPVSLEEIQEASSAQQRLKVFQKIIYLEDLLMDWNEICPLLTSDLSESSLTNSGLALQIIDLHRKWFHQGRSSGEYTPLLYGICQNLLETLAKAIRVEEPQEMDDNTSEISDFTLVASLVQNWGDMWLDLMQRDQYLEDLAQEMEQCMFSLFLRSDDSSKKSCMAQNILALVDPSAKWFQSWTNHVLTNDHLVSLLCSSSERDTTVLLPDLWIRIQTFPDNNGNNLNNNTPFLLHSIAIISIALCRTRLSQFPWEALTTKSTVPGDFKITTTRRNINNINNNFRTAIDEMLDLFLRVVGFVSLPDNNSSSNNNCSNDDDLKITVLDGVEAILAGSHNNNDNNSDFDRRYGKVTSSLQHLDVTGDKIVSRFLKIQLKQQL